MLIRTGLICGVYLLEKLNSVNSFLPEATNYQHFIKSVIGLVSRQDVLSVNE